MTSAKLRPIEKHWREYREMALPRACPPNVLREARTAFYSAVAATLAEMARTEWSIDTAAAMDDEVRAFLIEKMAELR